MTSATTNAPIAFFDIPYHSRLVTTLPIVRALVERGHRVHAFTLEECRSLVASSGAEVAIQPPFGPKPPDCTVNLRTIDYALEAVPAIVERLKAMRPALVVFTAKCLWAAIAAEICGLPTLVIHTNGLVPRGATISDAVFAHRWPGKTDEELAKIAARDHAAWSECAARFGSRRIHTDDVLPCMPNSMNLRGDVNVVYTSEEIQPRRPEFDDTYHFVGPCIDTRPSDEDRDFERALETIPRPLVYASLGSMQMYNDRPNVFQKILTALGDGPFGLVMSVGSKENVERLGPLPAHVLVRPYVPQLFVLKRTSLFFTHAGTNSVFESLLAGVPMIMLPQSADQPIFAEHMDALGLGHWLRDADIAPEALRFLIETLLADQAMARRVRTAGDGLRRAGGVSRAAEVISAFACRK